MAGTDRDKDVPAGIRLILEEIRDIKHEMMRLCNRSDEDRKRADEDRKRAAEDRRRADERWERLTRESDKRFERHVRESKEREKGLSRALVIIGGIGREIVKTQKEHTVLLKQILAAVTVRSNGQGGNGAGRGNGS